MNYQPTLLEGLYLISPTLHGDERGYFYESYRSEEFAQHISPLNIVQENQSCSSRGVLRGLHLQLGETAQAKLVRCPLGSVLDVAVDLRLHSPTYGQYYTVELSESNHLQLFVPRGFAHGFLTLSERAILQYKVDNDYSPSTEYSIRFDDNSLGIPWANYGIDPKDFILSPKDLAGLSLEEYTSQFSFPRK